MLIKFQVKFQSFHYKMVSQFSLLIQNYVTLWVRTWQKEKFMTMCGVMSKARQPEFTTAGTPIALNKSEGSATVEIAWV